LPRRAGWPEAVGRPRSSLRLVLASGSPTRLRVLRDAGLDPEVMVSGVSEEIDGTDTAAAVVTLAERKAHAVVEGPSESLILGCDTMLQLEGASLGKPASPAEARAMWRRLSGSSAVLHTGHCLIDARTLRSRSQLDSTLVHFGSPSPAEIDAYVATGEPLAVAGAFTLEGRSAPFIDGIDGDPSNVMGLSLPLLRRLLDRLGVGISDLWQ
jgi:septum formation protein